MLFNLNRLAKAALTDGLQTLRRRSFACFALTSFMVAVLIGTTFNPSVRASETSLAGIIYTENNSTIDNTNAIVAYRRDTAGNLTQLPSSPYLTGGTGITDPTFGPTVFAGSDQNVIVNPEHTRLFAVNSGSNSIAVFDIHADGSLSAVKGSPFYSGGINPVSVGLAGNFLYVANKNIDPQNSPNQASGSLPNYTGFYVHRDGKLTPIQKSTIEVPAGTDPTQAQISPDHKFLFGADAGGGVVRSFKILKNGRLKEAANSPLPLPASEFMEGVPRIVLGLQVHPTEPLLYAGFTSNSKVAVYSYDRETGVLTFLKTIPSGGLGNCWSYVNKAGTVLYSANTDDNSISVFSLADPTTPVLVQKFILTGEFGSNGPTNLALDEATESFLQVVGIRFLPNIPENQGNVLDILKVNPQDGTLTEVPSSPFALPAVKGNPFQGIVAL